MKDLFCIPRVYIPRKDPALWAVPGTCEPALREELERTIGEEPSALSFLLPEKADEKAAEDIAEKMYLALEDAWIEKLERGPILVERTQKGVARYGIVAAIDLESYPHVRGEAAPIAPAQEGDAEKIASLLALREKAPLEFTHAVAFYRDKKDKIIGRLIEEDLEVLYDFDLPAGGGHIKGYFLPDPFASWSLEQMQTRTMPALIIAEGVEEVEAAKAHWERVKPTLERTELAYHPARFCLVELENIYSDGVEVLPIHRLIEGVDTEALIGRIQKAVKCKRDGSLLYPVKSFAESISACDRILQDHVRENGGTVSYFSSLAELKERAKAQGAVGIVFGELDKEDILSAVKDGKMLPQNSFRIGGKGGRFLLEGREISYD